MTAFLFITDLDNTLVGDDTALKVLNEQLSQHRQEYGTKIVYATGRSRTSYLRLKTKKSLLDPDALISSVGTEIYFNVAEDIPNPQWVEKLSPGWNRDIIVATAAHFADLVPQEESEQRPFKVSYLLTETVATEVQTQLKSALNEQGVSFKFIYSGGMDLDIVPTNADKGLAVQFLQQYLKFKSEETIVCGDSGNDIALFSIGQSRGIIVGNAQPELREWYKNNPADYRYFAQAHCAGGILEGLQYFHFL